MTNSVESYPNQLVRGYIVRMLPRDESDNAVGSWQPWHLVERVRFARAPSRVTVRY